MNGGDPILGGGQANPDNTQPIVPGSQPAPSATAPVNPIQPSLQPSSPAPQAPQPSVSPAPAPINTSPSSDSFSSLTAQPSRPAAMPQAPMPGNSPSRPMGNGLPSSMPGPSRPPINPLAPNGFSNSQIPPSSFPTSSQVVFSDAGVVSADSSSGKGKKILIILLILLIIIGGVVAALFATGVIGGSQSTNTSSQPDGTLSTKEEVYDALWAFNTFHYSKLIAFYDSSVGLIPNFTISGNSSIFPAEPSIDPIAQELEESINAYNQIASRLPDKLPNDNIDLTPTKTTINNSLQSMKQNVDLIKKIYDAYVMPLLGNPKPNACDKTPDMITLEQGSTKEVADRYFMLYCSTVDFISNTQGDSNGSEQSLPQSITDLASEAAATLNKMLIEVPSATSTIEKLFEELTQ